MIKIKVFGQLTDVVGVEPIEILKASNIVELRAQLNDRFPLLATKKFNIAIDNKIVNDEIALQDGSVVCLLPPYSGG